MTEDIDKRITRILYILNALNRGEVSIKELAEDTGFNIRTIQRDMKTIQEADFPIVDIRRGVYTFVEGFNLGQMKITPDQAGILVFMMDITKTLGTELNKSFKQLCARLTSPNAENPFYFKLDKGMQIDNIEAVKVIERGIFKKFKLIVSYQAQDEIKEHLVTPIKIALYEGFGYLICFGAKKRLFKFRLDKITKVVLSKEKATFDKQKDGFDKEKIKEMMSQSVNIFFEGERNIEITLQIGKAVGHYFKKKEFFPEQKIIKENEDGSLIITSKVSKFQEVLMTIYHWLPFIKVISPKELETQVFNTLENYLKENKK